MLSSTLSRSSLNIPLSQPTRSTNFRFREIVVKADPTLFGSGCGWLLGVAPLECKDSVPTLQNKNLKENCAWYIDHKI